jgi:hypothetical protein
MVALNTRRPDVTAITNASLRALLVQCVQDTLGYPAGRVIVENMSDRRPEDGAPYATIWIKRTKFLVQNEGDFESTVSGMEQILHNECIITAQFSVYGADAYGETIKLSNAIHSANRWRDLWRVLGYAGQSSVQDISMLFGAKIQQRAFFDVDFYAYMGSAINIDWFNTAAIALGDESFIMPINHTVTMEFSAPAYAVKYGEQMNATLALTLDGEPAAEGSEVVFFTDSADLWLINGKRGNVFAHTTGAGGIITITLRPAENAPGATTTLAATVLNTTQRADLTIL